MTGISSEARKMASQTNGKLGGVKTDEGKEVSKLNAIKHGVLSNALQNGYDKANFSAIFKALGEEFNVKSIHQNLILEQLVMTYLKLARCSRIETEVMHEANNTTMSLEEACYAPIIAEKNKASISEKTLNRLEMVLIRYEPQLVNRMLKLIDILKKYNEDNQN